MPWKNYYRKGQNGSYTNTQKAYMGLKKRSYRLYRNIRNNSALLDSGKTRSGNVISDSNREKLIRSTCAMAASKKRVDRSISALSKVIYHDQAFNAKRNRLSGKPDSKAVIRNRNMRSYNSYLNSFKK